MGIRIDRGRKQQLIFFTIVVMLIALFTSRALLSISFIIFLLLTCIHKKPGPQLRRFFTSPFLLGMAFLFFIPFITWFWSEDKHMWERFARIKLPLLLFPLAFAGNWQLSTKQWRWVAYSFLFLVVAGCCWSLFQYMENYQAVQQAYLKAKIIATPLDNDHVRFSLVVCIAVITASFLIKHAGQRIEKNLLAGIVVFCIAYLHILSARTGLVCL
jgi:hypothetical protein